MSGGQDGAATQIDDGSILKIDPRLIENEMEYRGKEIEVRTHVGLDWMRRIFHTSAKDRVWCGDNTLHPWPYARIIEKKWRTPTDEDAKKRPKCRAKHSTLDWMDGILYGVESNASLPFVVLVHTPEGGVMWLSLSECKIEGEA